MGRAGVVSEKVCRNRHKRGTAGKAVRESRRSRIIGKEIFRNGCDASIVKTVGEIVRCGIMAEETLGNGR